MPDVLSAFSSAQIKQVRKIPLCPAAQSKINKINLVNLSVAPEQTEKDLRVKQETPYCGWKKSRHVEFTYI